MRRHPRRLGALLGLGTAVVGVPAIRGAFGAPDRPVLRPGVSIEAAAPTVVVSTLPAAAPSVTVPTTPTSSRPELLPGSTAVATPLVVLQPSVHASAPVVKGAKTKPHKPGTTATMATTTSTSAAPAPQLTEAGTPAAAAPTQRTIVGDAATNQYGPVQVALVMTGTQIDDVQVLQDPESTARDRSINADALPKLRQQVLAAQSADIDGVSGATYTSQSYELSVQSALDKS